MRLKLMCILAHPDDETFGPGGLLARYAAEGVETYLITATRGERGWTGKPEDYPGVEALGKIREAELRQAGEALGIHAIEFLDYIDGELDRVPVQELVGRLARLLRQIRPQVVLTFDPFGVYGHPDHIAISQAALASCIEAAGPAPDERDHLPPHQVSKLYYFAETQRWNDALRSIGLEAGMVIDGEKRGIVLWPHWAASAEVDTSAYWEQVVQAFRAHRSQGVAELDYESIPGRFDKSAWGMRTYYRAFSLVNGGRDKEHDLFEGLR